MAVCLNCRKRVLLNAYYGLLGSDSPESLCEDCFKKYEIAIKEIELSEKGVEKKREYLSQLGITEEGIQHLKKAIQVNSSFIAKEIAARETANTLENTKNIVVTTGDLHCEYEIIGPVYFQLSNKGLFSSALSELTDKYKAQIETMKKTGTMSEAKKDWGFLYGEWSVGQNQFESAFYIATQELKKRAALVGGDAIIGMRQDIDLDSNGFSYFYLQMYGTAVKILEKNACSEPERIINQMAGMNRSEKLIFLSDAYAKDRINYEEYQEIIIHEKL